MINRNDNNKHKTIESEKPLVMVLVQKVEGENIKLFVVGHEAIKQDTMKLIEEFGEKLLLNPDVRENAHIHKEKRVPIFRVMLEKEDVLCQTKYDITGNIDMLHRVSTIREQILKDINVFVSNLMQEVNPIN
jgi:hypothetical protein